MDPSFDRGLSFKKKTWLGTNYPLQKSSCDAFLQLAIGTKNINDYEYQNIFQSVGGSGSVWRILMPCFGRIGGFSADKSGPVPSDAKDYKYVKHEIRSLRNFRDMNVYAAILG